MSTEEKTEIQKLYENEKSKKFVNHLIKAYLPISKPTKLFTFEGTNKKKKCSVCRKPLAAINDVMKVFNENQEEINQDIIKRAQKELNGEKWDPEKDNTFIKKLNGREMAWKGEKTDTVLCEECIKNIFDLASNGLIRGDKNIVWLTNKMRRNEGFQKFKKSLELDSKNKEKVEKIHKKVDKKKKATFGDLEELQKLKEKMENETNKE